MRSLNIKPTILELNQYYEKNKKEGFFKIIFNFNIFKSNWFLILLQIFKTEDGQIDFADFLNILYAHMQVEDANKEILNAFVRNAFY